MPKHRAFSFHLSSPRRFASRRALPWLLLSLALISGCADNPVRENQLRLAPVAGPALNQALALEATGQSRLAAERYLELAASAPQPARSELQLMAARAFIAAKDSANAHQTLAAIRRPELNGGQRAMLHLTEGELAFLDGRARNAATLLDRIKGDALAPELQDARLATLAAARRLIDQPIAAAEALAERDALLIERAARLENQVELLTTLALSSPDRLNAAARRSRAPLRGWLELAILIHASASDPATLEARVQRWRREHPRHPTLPDLARAYLAPLSGGYAGGERVTVLLPRSGRFAGAATVIRNGLEAARRADATGRLPVLAFVDSAQTNRLPGLLNAAQGAGSRYVLGPLEKGAVEILAARPGLPVPTLALNQSTASGSTHPAMLYQFALSPEDEAVEVANKGRALGLRHALILHPANAWGERLASAFQRHWKALGGTVTASASFDPATSAYAGVVDGLARRQPAELLFLAATPDQARLIYPRTRAAAPDLRVIATSHVYSGGFEPVRDKPLIGLEFVDIPWMLGADDRGPLSRHRLVAGMTRDPDPLARLYAMGMDAYRLAPRLADLKAHPGSFYPGQTGALSVNARGKIQRRLTLARFTRQGPRIVEED